MKERHITAIMVALILVCGLLANTVLRQHYREKERKRQVQHATNCAEDRAAFDRCYTVPPPAPGYLQAVYGQCKAFWQPIINHSCYGMALQYPLPGAGNETKNTLKDKLGQ